MAEFPLVDNKEHLWPSELARKQRAAEFRAAAESQGDV